MRTCGVIKAKKTNHIKAWHLAWYVQKYSIEEITNMTKKQALKHPRHHMELVEARLTTDKSSSIRERDIGVRMALGFAISLLEDKEDVIDIDDYR